MYSSYCFICNIPVYSAPFSTLPSIPQIIKTQNDKSRILVQNPVKSADQCVYIVKQQPQVMRYETKKKKSCFIYAKKNVQSNVVNQVISFLTTQNKSSSILLKILNSVEKVKSFYLILKKLKNKNCTYVNRNVLQTLIELQQDHPIYISCEKLKGSTRIQLSQIRITILKLINYFLRNLIVPSLLTSSKLNKSNLLQHLSRVRQIYCYLFHKTSF